MSFTSKNLRADGFYGLVAVLGLGDRDPQPKLELREADGYGRSTGKTGDDRVAQKIDEEAQAADRGAELDESNKEHGHEHEIGVRVGTRPRERVVGRAQHPSSWVVIFIIFRALALRQGVAQPGLDQQRH